MIKNKLASPELLKFSLDTNLLKTIFFPSPHTQRHTQICKKKKKKKMQAKPTGGVSAPLEM